LTPNEEREKKKTTQEHKFFQVQRSTSGFVTDLRLQSETDDGESYGYDTLGTLILQKKIYNKQDLDLTPQIILIATSHFVQEIVTSNFKTNPETILRMRTQTSCNCTHSKVFKNNSENLMA
jgi:hypothetical protein